MIEVFVTIMAFFGFAVLDDVNRPSAASVDSSNQQIIRVIDSIELQGLNTLEAHNAEEWFV